MLLICQVSCRPLRTDNLLIVASASKITSLDPAQASTFGALQLLTALGDPLYRIDSNGLLEPRLASELPKLSDQGLTITIPLRKDVYFHDGTRFNADAMKFSLERFMEIGTLNYIFGERIKSIESPKPFLLVLKLRKQSTSLNSLLTSINLTPVSPKAYRDNKDSFLNKRFVGTGPYMLTSFQTQQKKLEVFPLYWDKKPNNKGINFIHLSNSTALFGAIKTGEVDVLISNSIEEDQRLALNKLSLKGKLNEGKGPALEIGYITLLSNSIPLKDNIIRQAISLSLDRDLISQRVSYSQRKPLRSLVPPILKNDKQAYWPKYNPIQAKKLFQESGYCEGKKLTIPLTFRSNVPTDKLLALTWKAQIEKDLSTCFSLDLNGVESTTVYKQLGQGAFEAVILDWRGAYSDPEAYLSPFLSCEKFTGNVCESGEAAISGSFWTTNGLQKSLEHSDQLTGQARLEKLNQIEKTAANGAAYIPLWLVTPKAWSKPSVSKPEFDGNGQVMLNQLSELSQ